MDDTSKQRPLWRWLRIVSTAVICLGILGASAAVILVINRTEPTAKLIEATRKSAALVETVTAQRGTYSPRLVVLGTVQPAQEIVLSPRVSGQIIELAPEFAPGGMVRKGDLLLQIDPADFRNALSIRESELRQAESSLAIEQGRQTLARKELALLEGTIDETNRGLVLREPQIASIEAEVMAAQAAVQRAQLDLERASLFAPFDAQILSRSVNVGSQVAPGDELAQLVGIEQYWIVAAVPVRSLHWVQFTQADSTGSAVTLRNADTWPSGAKRYGNVSRMIGTLDEETRLARVLITVPDPLGYETDAPPLILGSLLEAEIEGRPIEDVVRLDRDYVRERDTVWVMKNGKLEIRDVEVVFLDAEHAYIRKGLESGEEVVTTTLATVAEGIGLREADASSDDDGNSGESGNSDGEAAD